MGLLDSIFSAAKNAAQETLERKARFKEEYKFDSDQRLMTLYRDLKSRGASRLGEIAAAKEMLQERGYPID